MAAETPPLYIQAGTHPAKSFRRLVEQTYGERQGVLKSTDLEVTQRGAGANMSVDVAEGAVVVNGTEASDQGAYLCYSSATVNLTISASDPTNDRYDLIVAQVRDAAYSGSDNDWQLAVVEGTAAATPLFPSVPANSVVLATVLVNNGASSITNSDITDIRDGSDSDGTTTLINRGYAAPLGGLIVCTNGTRPTTNWVGQDIYETDTNDYYRHDGSQFNYKGADEDGLWKTYTPTNANISTSTNSGLYVVHGQTCIARISVVLDAAPTGNITLGLPVAAHTSIRSTSNHAMVHGRDNSATANVMGFAQIESAGTQITIFEFGTTSAVADQRWDATNPFTWASPDSLNVTIAYRIS